MSAKITANTKEMTKAQKQRKKVAKNAVQNSPFPIMEKAVWTLSQADGSKYSFCKRAQAICQVSSKNAKAAKQNATFCKILFFS